MQTILFANSSACHHRMFPIDPRLGYLRGSPGATSPVEASSGQITRHRLIQGGDRALNRAIHVIAGTRMRCDAGTIAYVARRRAEGARTQRGKSVRPRRAACLVSRSGARRSRAARLAAAFNGVLSA
jgi:hypothetical protein